ncbi:hypothetical protein OHB26_38740 (plasmid) [Nocardia sp. NBC_01503]|uniref:ParB family protein n=1 Tax=Nocardia sp. NBC_01503 TaxID=2975997 RepID=UPI002E7B2AA3|nr:hypothetical protein [Nocardia sp. NBC_01503]WTL36616.1 hypothetical protein OHB26_38740 [Nocardia sp. NBC_01503]
MAKDDAAGSGKVGNKGRIGAYFDQETADRVRGAYAYGWLGQGNKGSLSDMVKAAVMGLVEQLEQERNDGRPWPGLNPGAVRVWSHQEIADKKAERAEQAEQPE